MDNNIVVYRGLAYFSIEKNLKAFVLRFFLQLTVDLLVYIFTDILGNDVGCYSDNKCLYHICSPPLEKSVKNFYRTKYRLICKKLLIKI